MISCLQLLQGERRLTARYLSAQLGVSMRTVYRDIEALCEGGVPIHMERGPQGGIVLADGYRRALAQFTVDELQSIFAGGSGPMADLGVAAHPEALRKLAGALPDRQREAARTTRERLLLDHNRWGRGEAPTAVLQQFRRAIEGQRCVRFGYRDRSGAATERTVEPLGLVAKAGIWYLVAREAEKGYRTFRAQRVVGADVLTASFARPADFDLEAYWRTSVASIERRPETGYDVCVRVRADAVHRLALYWQPVMISQETTSATVRIVFPSRDVAVAEIVAGDYVIDIVSPSELAGAIVDYARAVIRKYGAADDGGGLAKAGAG